MIKLVLTDLDDTLIKNGLPRATDHALAGIHALLDAGREGQIIEYLTQAGDHPVALPFPEGLYLKGLVIKVS